MTNKSNNRSWSNMPKSSTNSTVVWIVTASSVVAAVGLLNRVWQGAAEQDPSVLDSHSKHAGLLKSPAQSSANKTNHPSEPDPMGAAAPKALSTWQNAQQIAPSNSANINESAESTESAESNQGSDRPEAPHFAQPKRLLMPNPEQQIATIGGATRALPAGAVEAEAGGQPLAFYDLQATRPESASKWDSKATAASSKIQLPDQAEINQLRNLQFKGGASDNSVNPKPAMAPQHLSPQDKKASKQRELARIKKEIGMPAPEHQLTSDLYDPWATEYNSMVRKEKDRAEQMAEEALRARQAENAARRSRLN